MIVGKYKWITKDRIKSEDIINSILEDRGIVGEQEKENFLNPSFDMMHNPMDLLDMDRAVKRIVSAKINKEKVTIYGDYDVDGITSTSILYMYLKENGYDIDYYIPDRIHEGYGFNNKALETIKERGSSLIISVDTGISATKEVEFADRLGIDIIITDHHECQDNLPDAYAIINPKRPGSTYPFKELAGVGVAFKLIHALALYFDNVDTIWKYIDLVAIGTVADVVPLKDENRIIVKNAFNTIPCTWNNGLKALLEVSNCKDRKISAGTIGYQIGPRLNVAGRLGDAGKGVRLFTTSSTKLAKDIAQELDLENKNRQQIEQRIFDEAISQIERDKIRDKNIIVVGAKGWHKGVIGIVASRITERYYKPSIIISIDEYGNATGSARSIEGFSIFEALSNCSQYLEKFGGHDMAAGLSLSPDNIDSFSECINEYSQDIINDDILRRKIEIDYLIDSSHINLSLIEDLEKLEPYGVGNPTPIFAYQSRVYSTKEVGQDGKHLKVQLYNEDKLIDAIGFNMGHYNDIISVEENIIIAGNLNKNEWLGKVTPQIVIRDIKSPDSEVKKSNFYLSLYNKLPVPSIDSINVFTNTIEICYINTYGGNNRIKSNKHYKSLLKHMIPDRKDAIEIYKYLRKINSIKDGEVSIHLLKTQVKREFMTEYKILQLMDIFTQLGLMSYKYNSDNGMIRFKITEGIKTDLSKSKRFNQLKMLYDMTL